VRFVGIDFGNRRVGLAISDATAMLARLNIDFVHAWDGSKTTQFWFSASGEQQMVDLTGLRWHARLQGVLPNTFEAGGEHWTLALDNHAHVVVLRNTTLEQRGDPSARLTFGLDSLIALGRLGRSGATQAPRLEAETPVTRATLVVRSFNGNLSADTIQYLQMDGDLYLSPPRAPE